MRLDLVRRLLLHSFIAVLGFAVYLPTAFALPSYAAQTGSECAACHIGGVGPHLTPYGISFKLGGYTDGDKKSVPVSAQLRASINETRDPDRTSVRLDEASIYLAGRLLSNVGAFVKVMHSDDRYNTGEKPQTELNNVDLRFATTTQVGNDELLWGISANNNPGIQDPLDANQAWGFPVPATTGSLFNSTTSPTVPLRVAGLTGYGFLDHHWYAEVGAYHSYSRSVQDDLGQPSQSDPGKFAGVAPYWRLAYLADLKTQFFGGGLFGMNVRRQLAVLNSQPLVTQRSGPYDSVQDVGADAVYEYLGDRENVLQLRSALVYERRRYGVSPVNPYTSQVAPGDVGLRELTISGTYVFKETYGITGALLKSSTKDPVRDYPFGQAGSKIRYAELFWTPFGKEDSWQAPFANLRLSAVWTKFDKFNGGAHNIFGPYSPNASDLNTFQVYAQVTF